LEVRLHSGTLNPVKILNWIDIIVCAIDAPAITNQVTTPEEYAATFETSTKLIEYMKKRVANFSIKSEAVHTEQDETINNYELSA
jgi:hypothetical protein